jgi:hypothetical protein
MVKILKFKNEYPKGYVWDGWRLRERRGEDSRGEGS